MAVLVRRETWRCAMSCPRKPICTDTTASTAAHGDQPPRVVPHHHGGEHGQQAEGVDGEVDEVGAEAAVQEPGGADGIPTTSG